VAISQSAGLLRRPAEGGTFRNDTKKYSQGLNGLSLRELSRNLRDFSVFCKLQGYSFPTLTGFTTTG